VTLVIGFTGKARHGKDLACELIAGIVPGARRYAFSDGIAAYARALGLMTARDPSVLQRVGLDVRDRNVTAWLDVVRGAIADHAPTLALISGVRYPNEAEMIRALGGYIVRVVRTNEDGSPFVSGDRDQAFVTETVMDGIAPDYQIDNVTGMRGAFRDSVLSTYYAIMRRVEEECVA
jgi:hypothetical protein